MQAWWATWRLALSLLLAGAVHALSFAPDPLPGWALSPLELITMAWLVHCVWGAPNAWMAARRAWLFALAHFVVGLYWLTISMHTYGLMPLPLAILALTALSVFLALYASFAAALTGNRFKFQQITLRNVLTALLGGVLLGWSSMIALGCTVGVLLSGTQSFALSGWVFFATVFIGSWLGIKLKLHKL